MIELHRYITQVSLFLLHECESEDVLAALTGEISIVRRANTTETKALIVKEASGQNHNEKKNVCSGVKKIFSSAIVGGLYGMEQASIKKIRSPSDTGSRWRGQNPADSV